MTSGHQPILELTDITKAFGGVEALRGVDFALSPGEIHGLVGENGAGKSTLMKIIAGVAAVTAGEKSGQGIPKHVITDGPVVTKANAAGMQWMEDHFLI